jgi:glutamyl-tRNA reductase
LEQCDIVLVSTASKTPIITRTMVKKALKKHRRNTLFLIDLSVPRNVEESVKKLENVFLYDVDDLEGVVAHNYTKRKSEITKANKIINKIEEDYLTWFKTLNLSPTIESLKNKFESLYLKELSSLKNKISENEFDRVEEFAHYIKGKCLGLVIKNLKTLSHNGQNVEYIDLVNNLFQLKDNHGQE